MAYSYPEREPKKKPLTEIYFPLTTFGYKAFTKECSKPGLGHPHHDPNDTTCDDVCACCCCPLTFSLDVFFIPFRLIGRLVCSGFRKCFRKKNKTSE